jgi:transcriptional regulator with PAS, ATPase and Fis domain
MNERADLLGNASFVKALIESLPCGLLVIDEDGCVRAMNNICEHVFGTPPHVEFGKGFGHILGCLHTLEEEKECGLSDHCVDCDLRRFAISSLGGNQRQRARTNLELVLDGQVRDVHLLVTTVPFSHKNKRFSVLILQDITKLDSLSPPAPIHGFRGIVSQDEKMQELFDFILQIAQTNAPVLIQGESGTGKELVALAVHKESQRAHKHFVPVNCGALPDGLLESELFGHVKGAFTGAIYNKKGRFEIADGGTIFLDEVSELIPAMQVKFLRVLQDGCFERVGSEKTIQVNVRVISATNKDLEREVAAGRFRQDLYYRLCVIPIGLPPLRERAGDIPILVDHFLTQLAQEACHPKPTISRAALSPLMAHSWPGNVRELQNVLQFAMARCTRDTIEPRDLPPAIVASKFMPSMTHRRDQKLQSKDVAEAMEKAGGNKSWASEILGVSRSTLYRFFNKQNSREQNT